MLLPFRFIPAVIDRELDVSPEDMARAVAYSTHFLSADNHADSSEDKSDAFDILQEWTSGTSAEGAVLGSAYRIEDNGIPSKGFP